MIPSIDRAAQRKLSHYMNFTVEPKLPDPQAAEHADQCSDHLSHKVEKYLVVRYGRTWYFDLTPVLMPC